MPNLSLLQQRFGTWVGENRLWFSGQPPRVSQTRLLIAPVAAGKFFRVDYTWEYEATPQDGSILFGYDGARAVVTAVWVDSWHMGEKFMLCEGAAEEPAVTVRGTYAAPPGPDWAWRIAISASGQELAMRMWNISPEGKEELAVEAVYGRSA
jgi:hypothetical protein